MKSFKSIVVLCSLAVSSAWSSPALAEAPGPSTVTCRLSGVSGINQKNVKVDLTREIVLEPSTTFPHVIGFGMAHAELTEGRRAFLKVESLDAASAPYRYRLVLQIYNDNASANPDTPMAISTVNSLPASLTLADLAHDSKMNEFKASLDAECK